MSTTKQKKLARHIVENLKADKPKNKKDLIVSSGYSEITAEASPHVIFEQKGVQEELKVLGFDENTAKRVVSEILTDETIEPQHRLKASEQVFKVQGSYAPEKNINLNLDAELTKNEGGLAEVLSELFS